MKFNNELKNDMYDKYRCKIKKWSYCPSCKSKMRYDSELSKWLCRNCGLELPAELYKSDTLFWYCEKCGSLLNDQEGFVKGSEICKCAKCGTRNALKRSNARIICRGCGKSTPFFTGQYCTECAQRREMKMGILRTIVCSGLAMVFGYALNKGLNSVSLTGKTDEELHALRDELQSRYKDAAENEADKIFWDMAKIDEELQRRAWGDEKPRGPGYHREHGYNLMKDD